MSDIPPSPRPVTAADRPLLIGISARIYYPEGPVLDLGGVWTKTLHYLEQSVAHWIMHGGAMAVMIPAVDSDSVVVREDLNLAHFARALDGLVLQGGNDVAPQSYGEQPLDPRWAGDPVRDHYEMELVQAFLDAGKPVFGICRGMQLLNVAFGGTLWQDIATQCPQALDHRDGVLYEGHFHNVDLVPGTWLAGLYPDTPGGVINSIHHQGIKDVAPGFVVQARCPNDGMVEAIRHASHRWLAAVQWHPEFHRSLAHRGFDDSPMLRDFLAAARAARQPA